MNFSQEEVIESSQSGTPRNSGRRSRPRRSNGTQRAPPKRTSQRNKRPLPVDGADRSSSVLLEIPQTDTEESSVGNLSGSLFTGQQDLLQQYQNHEQELAQRDALLEQALEQSRKVTPNRSTIVPKDVSCQTIINLQDAGVQCSEPKPTLCNVSIQLSPISQKRSSQNVATQSSPGGQPKLPRISTSTNTDHNQQTNSSAQTTRIETNDVAIQKYHSTRVREVAAQTDAEIVTRRGTSRRNVSIQHRSTGMLDLNTANTVGLGIALHCDPARLQRVLAKMAAEQHNHHNTSGEADSSGNLGGGMSDCYGGAAGLELFGPGDPYYENYGYFMEEEEDGRGKDDGETDAGSSTRTSELLEREVSCLVEEEYIG